MIYQRGHLARPLDVAFSNASRLSTLRALFTAPDGLSGRQVAVRAGINHQAAAQALKALESAGFVRRRAAPRSIQWTLNRDGMAMEEMLLPLFESEARFAVEIVGEIKGRLDRCADAVVIVGSAARGRLSPGEPLELVVLCEHGRRRALHEELHGLIKEMAARFGVALNVETLTKKEAPRRIDILDGWQLLPTEGRPSVFTGR
jgi:predicted nucleotidyltransferase